MKPTSAVPDLYCPFPSVVIDEAVWQRTHARLADWMSRYLFWERSKGLEHYLRMGAIELVMRTVPEPVHEELFQADVDFIMWLLVLDDVYCDEANPHDIGAYLEVLPHLMAVFDGSEDPASSANPFVGALVDIRQRLLRFGSRRQVCSFGSLLKEYMLCMVWELQVRARGRLPGFANYYRMRPWTGGTMPCFVISAMANGADPDERELALSEVLAMTKLAREHVVFSNDLFSAAKEAALEVMPMQMPLVLVRERDIGIGEAMRSTADMCNDMVREFLAYQARVEAQASLPLKRYIANLRGWIRGNIDWSLACRRYNTWEPEPAAAL